MGRGGRSTALIKKSLHLSFGFLSAGVSPTYNSFHFVFFVQCYHMHSRPFFLVATSVTGSFCFTSVCIICELVCPHKYRCFVHVSFFCWSGSLAGTHLCSCSQSCWPSFLFTTCVGSSASAKRVMSASLVQTYKLAQWIWFREGGAP